MTRTVASSLLLQHILAVVSAACPHTVDLEVVIAEHLELAGAGVKRTDGSRMLFAIITTIQNDNIYVRWKRCSLANSRSCDILCIWRCRNQLRLIRDQVGTERLYVSTLAESYELADGSSIALLAGKAPNPSILGVILSEGFLLEYSFERPVLVGNVRF